eukprot:309324_1
MASTKGSAPAKSIESHTKSATKSESPAAPTNAAKPTKPTSAVTGNLKLADMGDKPSDKVIKPGPKGPNTPDESDSKKSKPNVGSSQATVPGQ